MDNHTDTVPEKLVEMHSEIMFGSPRQKEEHAILTADVAVKFNQWYNSIYDMDGRYRKREFAHMNDHQLFDYFINHLYSNQ